MKMSRAKLKVRKVKVNKVNKIKAVHAEISAVSGFENPKKDFKNVVRKVKKYHKENTLILQHRDAYTYLTNLAGEGAIKLAQTLGEPMTDIEAANVSKLKISGVRMILNKLHSEGLAEYKKKRHPESNWYTYMWSINLTPLDKIMEHAGNKIPRGIFGGEKTVAASGSVNANESSYFVCSTCQSSASKVSFDVAMDRLFRCHLCGAPLISLDE
ncbi:MAG: hypothetical protein ABIH99_04705 [Candidatus Micrarchaeota archaeon]